MADPFEAGEVVGDCSLGHVERRRRVAVVADLRGRLGLALAELRAAQASD